MPGFHFHDQTLHCEHVAIDEVAAQVKTPFYLYSKAAIKSNVTAVVAAFSDVKPLVCYALKANSNPHILQVLSTGGLGADVVSGGEIHLALQNGFLPEKIVYAGVGKTDAEIEYALCSNIYSFNVESVQELVVINEVAGRLEKQARIGLRINPAIDIDGHPYISTGKADDKFGIDVRELDGLIARLPSLKHIHLVGLHSHTGSMIENSSPYLAAIRCMTQANQKLRTAGVKLEYMDLGGGLGVDYHRPFAEPAEKIAGIIRPLLPRLREFDCQVIFEPGRSLVAAAGILVTRVLYTKESGGKQFAVVDAGMTDLLRPSLYGAYHEVVHITQKDSPRSPIDVVGPVCESGDFFARDRMMPHVNRGDLLAVMTAGAYGYVLATNYNSRPRPAELLVDGAEYSIIRQAENWQAL